MKKVILFVFFTTLSFFFFSLKMLHESSFLLIFQSKKNICLLFQVSFGVVFRCFCFCTNNFFFKKKFKNKNNFFYTSLSTIFLRISFTINKKKVNCPHTFLSLSLFTSKFKKHLNSLLNHK
jgi:hypothetical protein